MIPNKLHSKAYRQRVHECSWSRESVLETYFYGDMVMMMEFEDRVLRAMINSYHSEPDAVTESDLRNALAARAFVFRNEYKFRLRKGFPLFSVLTALDFKVVHFISKKTERHCAAYITL